MLLLLLAGIAWAGDDNERDDDGKKVVYRSQTEIDFEDLEIEGDHRLPIERKAEA